MRSPAPAAASWRRITLLATALMLFWSNAVFAKDKPDMSVSKFDHPPLNINYFEDSDVILFQDVEEQNVYRSEDAGVSWKRVSDIPDGVTGVLIMHRFESKTAFVLTEGRDHWRTTDRGKSWKKWDSLSFPSGWQPELLVFHADDPKRIIFNGMDCDGIFCSEEATYTTDGFESTHGLRPFTSGCWWAKSSPEFTTGDEDLDKNRVMCIVQDPFSFFKEDQRLAISDSFYKVADDLIDEFEPNMDTNKGVEGVVNLAIVKKYLLVATASPGSDEMALFVSDDTLKWHRAMFPSDDKHDHSHKITQSAYTVLESTNYSIQVDVMTSHPSNPMGVLFTSNSNGTYFTENVPYTNRNARGNVDFEKITGIQGVYLVNVVSNGAEAKKLDDNKVVTKITFDDGRTFEEIKAGDDKLHLHSETELDNVGRVFSSPAPGLVMGNGNTGDNLKAFSEANLYVSDDAGLTWKQALKGPHKYEFGDSGSVLVAVRDSADYDIEEYSYSLDHGENWKSVKFPGDIKIKPDLLTTTQDSTSLKFILLGEEEGGPYHMIAIDFDGLNERKCGKDDMEDWHARVDDDGKPTCIMGHKQTYRRRKKSADCFIMDEFEDPVPKVENCECSDRDFECDYNFQRDPEDNTLCKKVGPIARPEDACKKDGDSFKGSSGWRLIPGNTCKRSDGKQKDDTEERKCSDAVAPPSSPASGKVSKTEHIFDDMELDDFQKVYLETGKYNDEEVVIARPAVVTSDGRAKIEDKIWLSKDQGKKWERILKGEKIRNIYPHLYFKDMVFFTTESKKVIYSIDQGDSFHHFDAPTDPGDSFPLSFHPDKKDWLIWVGEHCDDVGGKESCYPQASISKDRGDNWATLQRYVKRCEFTGHSAYKFRPSTQIICLAMKEERDDAPRTVVTSNDFFEEDKTMFDGEVTNFATMSEFILLGGQNKETDELYAYSSLDGKNFAQAQFPPNFHLGHDNEYTVLDSSTHAINLFVLAEKGEDREYGSVVKSNSNGTSYIVSAANVNSNLVGYVDYEKVGDLEGVALINVVANKDDRNAKGKRLQTKISHNDGSEWGYLAPPAKDVDGKGYGCRSDKGDAKCALHLHHYTERDDKKKTFGVSTAVGLMLGVGNVGSSLGDIKDADTFLSTDGGIKWKSVKKGQWTWQYGDQGSIIVLVQMTTHKNPAKTRYVTYSLDQGETWENYEFADSDVTVLDITTVRSGMSRNFLLWCRSGKGKMYTVNLDFSGLTDGACKKTDDGDSDYYLWSPKHPLQDDDCLFGHISYYLRKKPGRQCYNDENLQHSQSFKNCECSRRDYEW